MTKKADTILDEALRIVYGAREHSYGHPLDDFTVTAKIWSAILGFKVLPESIPLCMIGVKISREIHCHKRDNLVDMAGYADTLQRLLDERARRLKKIHKTREVLLSGIYHEQTVFHWE